VFAEPGERFAAEPLETFEKLLHVTVSTSATLHRSAPGRSGAAGTRFAEWRYLPGGDAVACGP
jgi:hypothetical protein